MKTVLEAMFSTPAKRMATLLVVAVAVVGSSVAAATGSAPSHEEHVDCLHPWIDYKQHRWWWFDPWFHRLDEEGPDILSGDLYMMETGISAYGPGHGWVEPGRTRVVHAECEESTT